MGAFLKRVFWIFVLGLVVLYFARNAVTEWTLEAVFSHRLGASVQIQRVSLDLRNAYLWLEGLQIANPKDYPDHVFLRISEAYLEWRYRPLIRRILYLPRLGVNVDEIVVVKTPYGGSNLAYFYQKLHPLPLGGPSYPSSGAGRGEKWNVQIGSLGISFRQLVFRDYSRGPVPEAKTLPLNTGQYVITNLRGLGDVFAVIALQVVSLQAIGFVGLDPSHLQQELGTVQQRVQSAQAVLQQLQEFFR